MNLSTEDTILVWLGPLPINAHLAYTWLVMAALVLAAFFVTRRLRGDPSMSRWQTLLEVLVGDLREQIRQDSIATELRDIGAGFEAVNNDRSS